MNREQELENYLSVAEDKIEIYLFDKKNSINLYKDDLVINAISYNLYITALKRFLDKNIFKIEKISGKFIQNIFLIIEDKKNLNIEIGIKKKNYNISLTKEYLKNCLIEVKDLFRENYQNQEIMHMIIKKYLINGKIYPSYEENLKCDHLALEIEFKSVSKDVIHDLNKILENYQIKIIKYLDGNYIKALLDNKMELPEMTHRIMNGYNEHEITFVQKNTKKLGFFEKFFQLFS